MERGISLDRHVLDEQRRTPGATGDFTTLLSQIALASKIINSKVNQAGLVEVLGLTGDVNVQGEEVQKLDDFANRTMIRSLEAGGLLCVMASEEVADVIPIPDAYPTGKYVLMFDPLDGSSNIDTSMPIGTIWSVHRRVTVGRDGTIADCLQKGSAQVAAGYILYGASTMFVYSTGRGVHGFTLDPSIGEFFLSHPDIRMPDLGESYSINESNTELWDDRMRAAARDVKKPDARGKRKTLRYVGTLVADFHRTLIKGGVFAYPSDKKSPNGKLRLLYECCPMAFLAQEAGGAATDGKQRILDIEPRELHQRSPLVIGSKADVDRLTGIMSGTILV